MMSEARSKTRLFVYRMLYVIVAAAFFAAAYVAGVLLERWVKDIKAGKLAMYILMPLLPRLHPYFASADARDQRIVLRDTCLACLVGWSGPVLAAIRLAVGSFPILPTSIAIFSGVFLGAFSYFAAGGLETALRYYRERRTRPAAS
jgi:hypothetical protein